MKLRITVAAILLVSTFQLMAADLAQFNGVCEPDRRTMLKYAA